LGQQLKFLRKIANIVPLEDALQKMANGRLLPPRAVAITFDDGYRDNLTIAGPMVRHLGVPATCFLVPDILSGTVSPWWEELAWALLESRSEFIGWSDRRFPLRTRSERRAAFQVLSSTLKGMNSETREAAVAQVVAAANPREPYRPDLHFLDWPGAARLRDYMTIGSHSLRHAILSCEEARAQQADLVAARQQLSERLGVEINILAYPNGSRADYNGKTLEAAAQAGYAFGVTTEPGWNTPTTNPYEIRRSVLTPQRGAVELGKVVRDFVMEGS
jgi:peptidoglycan/xylan/chitin deacetylase (PgdA/CDA1 family)